MLRDIADLGAAVLSQPLYRRSTPLTAVGLSAHVMLTWVVDELAEVSTGSCFISHRQHRSRRAGYCGRCRIATVNTVARILLLIIILRYMSVGLRVRYYARILVRLCLPEAPAMLTAAGSATAPGNLANFR